MKILAIYFRNLNSLQGEHLIDFSQAPLLHSGLFAITGPNGSGKSTILDAITLALYGETFKFDRPAEHVITKNTQDSFAQVNFEIKGIRYQAKWQAAFEQQQCRSTMTLLRLSDNAVLAEDILQARTLIKEIVGLDFKNFTRSILLAQGDFAAFLNALDSERLDILEKIVDSDLFADYQQELSQKVEQFQRQVLNLQNDLAALPLMDDASRHAKEADLQDFQEQLLEYKQAFNDNAAQLETFHRLHEMEQIAAQQAQKIIELSSKRSQLQAQLSKLGRFQDLGAFQTRYAQIQNLEQSIQKQQAELESIRRQLADLETQSNQSPAKPAQTSDLPQRSLNEQQDLIAAISFENEQVLSEQRTSQAMLQNLELQLREKQSIEANIEDWLTAHARDALLIDNFPEIGKLRRLSQDIIHYKAQQSTYLKNAKSLQKSQNKNEAELASVQKLLPNLEQEIQQLEQKMTLLIRGQSLEEVESLRQDQAERAKDFKDLLLLAKIRKRFQDGWLVRLGLVKPAEELNSERIRAQIDKLSAEFRLEENIKLSLEHAVKMEGLIKKLAPDRAQLSDQEPCPLCGSLEHPYAIEPPKVSDSQQALLDQKKRLGLASDALNKAQQQLKVAEKQQQAKQLRHERLQKIEAEWATLCNRLNVMSTHFQPANLRLMKHHLKREQEQLENLDSLLKEYRGLQKKLNRLNSEKTHQQAVLEQLLLTQEDIKGRDHFNPEEMQGLEQKIIENTAIEQSLSQTVLNQLTELGEKMPSKNKEEVFINRLTARRQEYQTYLLRQKHIREELLTLQEQLIQAQKEHQQKLTRSGALDNKLQSEQWLLLHLAIIDKQKLIQDKQLLLTSQQGELSLLQNQLQTEAQAQGMSGYSELAEIFQLLPQQAMLQHQTQEIDQALLEIETASKRLQNQLLQGRQQLKPGMNLEQIEALHKSLSEKIRISEMEIQHSQQVLDQQLNILEKHSTVSRQLQQSQLELDQAKAELQVLAAGQNLEARRKVQQRMADKLLTQTNAILEKLSGRYYVRQANSDNGLALEIEDTFQENQRRLPKTLSGGESFIVSLALALGLAEMASNGRTIESLFLDEGFGNLDAETLYTVVSTLENLQTQGRKVGVISHVEGIRKRIKTQIELIKKTNGLSELRAVA